MLSIKMQLPWAWPQIYQFRRCGWGPGVCVCNKPPGTLVTRRVALPGTMSSVSPGRGQRPSAVSGLFSRPQGSPQARACRPCVPGSSSRRGSAGGRVSAAGCPSTFPAPASQAPRLTWAGARGRRSRASGCWDPLLASVGVIRDLPGPHRHRHQLFPPDPLSPGRSCPTPGVAPAADLGPCSWGGRKGALTCGETPIRASADFRLVSTLRDVEHVAPAIASQGPGPGRVLCGLDPTLPLGPALDPENAEVRGGGSTEV